MKAFTALVLVSIMLSVSTVASPTCAYDEPLVGVKEGDWMEYNVDITGIPPPIHNVTWMRIEVLQIEGKAAFSVNLTVRYANGTFYSSIWKFNFTEGNVEGWVIIPSNLGPKDTFYDNFLKNRQKHSYREPRAKNSVKCKPNSNIWKRLLQNQGMG